MIPTITDTIAAIKTLAAPASFAIFAKGCFCGLTRSMVASIPVFIHSADQTAPIVRVNIAQSWVGIFNQMAKMITDNVATAWMRALCCVRRTHHQPENAYLKDERRE